MINVTSDTATGCSEKNGGMVRPVPGGLADTTMIIKLLIVLLIIACIAPLFITGPDGEPIMTLDDWKPVLPASVDELADGIGPGDPSPPPQGPVQVYRWQDESGSWHFSDTPPAAADAEQIEISETNLMPAQALPDREAETTPAAEPVMPTAATMSPAQIRQAMETVTRLQETVDQRKADLDAAVKP